MRRPIYVSPRHLAERWAVSVRTVQRLCAAGKLAHVHIGGQLRIVAASAEAYELSAFRSEQ